MNRTSILMMLSFLVTSSLFSQTGQGTGFSFVRNLVYFSQGDAELYLDLYTPVVQNIEAGAVLTGKDQKPGSAEKIQAAPVPVLIWLPRPGTDKFPTPAATFTGNGYSIVSVRSIKDSEVIKTISRVAGFLKSNAQKYNLDTRKIGIIQQVDRGYLAVIWQDGMKRLELLSDAETRISIGAAADKDYLKFQSPGNSKIILDFFDRHLMNGVHKPSDPLSLKCPPDSWADPIINPIPGTVYNLFPIRVKGKDTRGSYLIYLPEGYASSNKKYPVIYWLHGDNGNSREGWWMCEKMKEAMQKGDMPRMIIVFVQGLPAGWYNNSKDSTMPVEDVIIKDLIPYIDANYRTINRREARGIDGIAMGGYGSLHLGFKYPELFGVVSSIAPGIATFEMESKEVIAGAFDNDTTYLSSNSPETLVLKHADLIRGRTIVRLLIGDKDLLYDQVQAFHKKLSDLQINHQYSVAKDASHDYKEVIGNLGFNSFTFWKDAFASLN